MNKYFKLLLIILIIAVVIPQITLAAWWNPFSWGVWNRIWNVFQKQTPVACTKELKLCPDGSSVSRQGPKCEFAECPKLVGGDKDEHGCIGSAGYSWCETKQKCLREWEEKCEEASTNKDYAKQISATTYEANIKFLVPVKASDLNSNNIKPCVKNASARAGADPNTKCENDNSWQFSFSYNSDEQILNIKTLNINPRDRENDIGPFNIGCASCTEGLNLSNIYDKNGNILPSITIFVHKDYNE